MKGHGNNLSACSNSQVEQNSQYCTLLDAFQWGKPLYAFKATGPRVPRLSESLSTRMPNVFDVYDQ